MIVRGKIYMIADRKMFRSMESFISADRST